jgi:hypothetical protein
MVDEANDDKKALITDTVGLDNTFISKITETLDKILVLIKLVTYDDKDHSIYGRFGRSFNRNIYGGFYTKELLRELTIMNSYFIIYESKVNHIVKRYEHEINNNETVRKTWNDIYIDKLYSPLIAKETPKDGSKYPEESKLLPEKAGNMFDKNMQYEYLSKGEVILTTGSIFAVAGMTAQGLAIGFASTGIGIPVAAILFAVAEGAKLIRNKKELLYVVHECSKITQMCFKIHCANCCQLSYFEKAIKGEKNQQEIEQPNTEQNQKEIEQPNTEKTQEEIERLIDEHIKHVTNSQGILGRIHQMAASFGIKSFLKKDQKEAKEAKGGKRTKKKNKKHRTKRSKYMRQKSKRRHTAKRRASKK